MYSLQMCVYRGVDFPNTLPMGRQRSQVKQEVRGTVTAVNIHQDLS